MLDQGFERLVRGRDHPNVNLDGLRLAERMHFARLEKAQELHLKVEADLADLVEEERPAFVGANHPQEAVDGAGERAPAVPEQVAVQHVARHGGADEHAEVLAGARR